MFDVRFVIDDWIGSKQTHNHGPHQHQSINQSALVCDSQSINQSMKVSSREWSRMANGSSSIMIDEDCERKTYQRDGALIVIVIVLLDLRPRFEIVVLLGIDLVHEQALVDGVLAHEQLLVLLELEPRQPMPLMTMIVVALEQDLVDVDLVLEQESLRPRFEIDVLLDIDLALEQDLVDVDLVHEQESLPIDQSIREPSTTLDSRSTIVFRFEI